MGKQNALMDNVPPDEVGFHTTARRLEKSVHASACAVQTASGMLHGAGENDMTEEKSALAEGPDIHDSIWDMPGSISIVPGKNVLVDREDLVQDESILAMHGYFLVPHIQIGALNNDNPRVHKEASRMHGQEFSVHRRNCPRSGQKLPMHGKEFSRERNVCDMHLEILFVYDRRFFMDNACLVRDKDVCAMHGSDRQLRSGKRKARLFFSAMCDQEKTRHGSSVPMQHLLSKMRATSMDVRTRGVPTHPFASTVSIVDVATGKLPQVVPQSR